MTENKGRKVLDFIETLSSVTMKTFAKNNSDIFDIEEENYTPEYIAEYVKSKKPINRSMVSTFCYYINLYAKYIGSEKLSKAVLAIDKTALYKEIGQTAKRFISKNEFDEIYELINVNYELNSLYKKTMLRCVWEGMFSSSLDVLKNLRASDIHGNVITLRTDSGEVYDLEVSQTLADDLVTLSNTFTRERVNRHGYFDIAVDGKYHDSCFKVENRGGTDFDRTMTQTCWYTLRELANTYIGSRFCHAKQIFVSGIMYRISIKLKEAGIDLYDAFSYDCKDKLATKIIMDEMHRCNYNKTLRSLKEVVDGYLDNFVI